MLWTKRHTGNITPSCLPRFNAFFKIIYRKPSFTCMRRLKPFVILDALVTLPLLVYATYDTFKLREAGVFWFEVFILGCALAVMFPSFVCVIGLSLNQSVAVVCLLFYLALLVFMWFRLLSGWYEPHHATLVRVGIFLLIAKSIYGVISVTKTNA